MTDPKKTIIAALIFQNEDEYFEHKYITIEMYDKMKQNMEHCLLKALLSTDKATSVELRMITDEGERMRIEELIYKVYINEELYALLEDYKKYIHSRDLDFWISRYIFQKNKASMDIKPATDQELDDYNEWIAKINSEKE